MFLQPLELLSKRSSKNRAQRRSAASRAILRSGVQHRSLCDPAPARGGKGIRVRTFLCPYLVTNLKPRMRNGRITLVQHVERPHNPGYNMQRHTSMLTRALEEAACTASLAVRPPSSRLAALVGRGPFAESPNGVNTRIVRCEDRIFSSNLLACVFLALPGGPGSRWGASKMS